MISLQWSPRSRGGFPPGLSSSLILAISAASCCILASGFQSGTLVKSKGCLLG